MTYLYYFILFLLYYRIINLNLKENIFINYMNEVDNLNDTKQKSCNDVSSENIDLLIKKLNNCIEIHPDNYEDLDKGIWIKYITRENKYRTGGILLVNKYPEYIVLKNPYYNRTWCVNLSRNTIFVNNNNGHGQEMIEKNNLYKLYKQGYIKILDEPDEDFLKQKIILFL